MTLYKKLMILYCLLVTLLVGCFYTASYYTSRETLDQKNREYMNHIGDLISLKIWRSIDELDTTIQRAIFDMYLTELLSNYNEKNAAERRTALDYLSNKVNQLTSLNPYVEAVDLYFYNGDQWITPDSKPIPNVFETPYYFINNLNQKLEWIDYEKESNTINGSKILMDAKGRAIALMIVKVNQSFLTDLLQEENLTDSFTFYLTNQEGKILSASDPDMLGSMWRETENRELIRTEREVTVLHWNLYLQVPKVTFWSYVHEYGRNQIMLTLIILLLGLLTSFAMALSISKPIQRLTNQMRKVASVNLNMTEVPATKNDIAFLEHSFYRMLRRIDELINNVYKETIYRRESELKALQAQVNPHFLFNVLDLLNWKALMSKQKEISNIVQSLGRLMEANLKMDEKTVSLEQELSYVRDYYNIVSQMFGNQIVLEEEVDPHSRDFPIPKLLLQPLVENSIKHGFEYIRPGRIWLKTVSEKDGLTIRIADDGQGMSEERLKRIRDILSRSGQRPFWNSSFPGDESERDCVGLLNTAQRLQIMYGQRSVFHIDSTPGNGTEIVMTLPLEEEAHV